MWDWFSEYLRHLEDKFDGDVGSLERKHVTVGNIVHIGKESNGLEESEILGLNDSSYEIYEDKSEIERKILENKERILKLRPKDVKDFGISRQTLWNVQTRIKEKQLHRISVKIKNLILEKCGI